MPYIPQWQRRLVDGYIDKIIVNINKLDIPPRDGVVNYVFTRILKSIYNQNPNYHTLNKALGVLNAVNQEFYRTIVGPYEETKKDENGDIA